MNNKELKEKIEDLEIELSRRWKEQLKINDILPLPKVRGI